MKYNKNDTIYQKIYNCKIIYIKQILLELFYINIKIAKFVLKQKLSSIDKQ